MNGAVRFEHPEFKRRLALLVGEKNIADVVALCREAFAHRFSDEEASRAAQRAWQMWRDNNPSEASLIIDDVARDDHHAICHVRALLARFSGLTEKAEEQFRETIAKRPERSDAWSNLGLVLFDLGRPAEAMEAIAKAHEMNPQEPAFLSNLIFGADHVPWMSQSGRRNLRKRYQDIIVPNNKRFWGNYTNEKKNRQTLRVGYVSGDFRSHSAAALFGPVLMGHTKRIEWICFSGASGTANPIGETFRQKANGFHDVRGMTDEALDALIRKEKIDVLVDLSGHSSENRMQLFSRKPAPVQLTAWGFPTGTGLDAMDWIFDGPERPGANHERSYQEKPWRLVAGVPIVPPREIAPAVSPSPFLTVGDVTFGCLNGMRKLNPITLHLFARVLNAVPNSRILFKNQNFSQPSPRKMVTDYLGEKGVVIERIGFLGATTREEHLAAFANVDICLEPIPAGGGMTLIEGLWQGVPTVALEGPSVPERGNCEILDQCGLSSFVAKTKDEYVEIAKTKTSPTHLPALATLRNDMRAMIDAAPAANIEKYVREVEDAYFAMFDVWAMLDGRPGGEA